MQSAPPGWSLAGTAPDDYALEVQPSDRREGRAAVLRARADAPRGFATVMQRVAADAYRGARVRFAAWVRSDGAAARCALWMRVDAATRRAIAFDNMADRAIRGTTGWTRYEVVLDVAHDAEAIAFGMLLEGDGTAWLDDVAFESVCVDVATTGRPLIALPRRAVNLGFEDAPRGAS